MSDLTNRIKQWARNMGYDGELPDSLNKICSPSTAFIWEQLISNVKPKQDVAHIRRNVIVQRLKERPLSEQSKFNYPVKELDVFLKKRALEKKVKILEKSLEEKEMLTEHLLEKNKKTYVTIDNVKRKIKENIEKKFLLEQKCKMLEDDLHNAEEVLILARNLTPVEMEENANGNDITETLQKCAEKLYKLSQEVPFVSNTSQININRSLLLTPINTKTPRNLQKKSTFPKFMNGISVKKLRCEDKENIFVDNASFNVSVKKSSEKKSLGNDSLCLLSRSFMETYDDFDDFFLSKHNESQSSFIKTLSNKTQSSANSLQEKTNYEIFEKLRDNQMVRDTLKNLLYRNNRQLIIKCCQKVYEFLLTEMKNSTLEYNKKDKTLSFLDQEDLSDLYFIHIKSELEKQKHQAVVQKLQENVRRRKEKIQIAFSFMPEDVASKQKRKFELQVEEAFLIASNNFLRQKIESLKRSEVSDELQTVSLKIKKTKEEIFLKVDHIQALIENINNVFEQIKSNREEALSYVRSISPYIFNLSSATPLKEELNSKEIQVFEKFPLEFNRKFANNDLKYFYRNVSDTTVPSYVNLDSDNLEMITTLIDTPFSPAESVAVNMLRSKIKLNLLKSFQILPMEIQNFPHTYTTEELHRREECIKDIINKLNFMINSSSVKDVLSAPSLMQEVVDLWTEMPFRNFISEKRLVEGQSYKFFEKMFDNLYNNF